ncbi:hypothetical protein R1flu_006901 [Riccia fluitans]|uniref:Uncharacterized protein n=1 Tax=Riccia fluitans TaxID=41844 RepID=A0ABD1Z1F4_9MARC
MRQVTEKDPSVGQSGGLHFSTLARAQNPKKVLTQSLLARVGLRIPRSGKGIDSTLSSVRRPWDSRIQKRYQLDPSLRVQDSGLQAPEKVLTRFFLARAGLQVIDSILPRAHRTRETPGSEKVTHLALRSAEPEKGIDSIPPCARRPRDSRIRKRYRLDPNLARAGLESPGSEKGVDSILTLRA